MADYIDREELLKLYSIEELGDVNINELQVPFMVVRQNIIDMPSADVQPIINPYNNHPICPYCGRDLKGVIKDDG